MAQADPGTPKRSSRSSRWPLTEDPAEGEAWVTPAIGPAAEAAAAAAAAAMAAGGAGRGSSRGVAASDSRQPPATSYRGVTTAAPGTPRPTTPPAVAYSHTSPYSGGKREPDEQLPLAYDRADFPRSGHLAALSRIGEEESEDSTGGRGAGRSAGRSAGGSAGGDDSEGSSGQARGSRQSKGSRLSFGDDPEELHLGGTLRGGGECGTRSTGSGMGTISTAGSSSADMSADLTKGDSGLEEMPGTPSRADAERPLWQQNRQRNRNLMWS